MIDLLATIGHICAYIGAVALMAFVALVVVTIGRMAIEVMRLRIAKRRLNRQWDARR